ncbi:hypothetical protein J4Q44_G00182510 [Coregonus suidteri]|uniref:Ion transport domain-containing protein n=1 Tax=Coregonus suidteri TaxID=861788 RepID=A0AAN8LHS2_9TELE
MFDHVVLVFIFLNCITIALERPGIQPHSTERVFLSVSNYVFTLIFLAEMTVKIVALGFCWGKQSYLKSSWNVLDGILVFVSLVDILVSLALTGGNRILGILRVLRLLRTLRPLRVISSSPRAEACSTDSDHVSETHRKHRPHLLPVTFFIHWREYRKYNFDNLGQALMSLFVLSCKDGWVNIMYDGLDAVGVDQQPVRNHNPWMLLYFISFLLIVSFFVLNMFVGVVVENFHKCRQDQEEEEQRLREEKRLKILEKKRRSKEKDGAEAQQRPYYSDYSPVRLAVHTLCTSHYLDLFITVIIAINVLTMSMEHYNQPQYLEEALKYCNYVFTCVFIIETLLKLVAFGLNRFFKDRWNQLDLAIVLLSIMGITLEELKMNASLPINPTIIRIMRVLRIARVLKLLKMATGMRALLDTVMQALPQEEECQCSQEEELLSPRKMSVSRMHSLPNDSYMFPPVRPASATYPLQEDHTSLLHQASGSVTSVYSQPWEEQAPLSSLSPPPPPAPLVLTPPHIAPPRPSPRGLRRQVAVKVDSVEEVCHITSSARHWWDRHGSGRCHSLSPYASPVSPASLRSRGSALSLLGAGLKGHDPRKGFSVDTQGFLDEPRRPDDQRRHSTEICPSPPEDPPLGEGAEVRGHGKKRMSPPCISIHPPRGSPGRDEIRFTVRRGGKEK